MLVNVAVGSFATDAAGLARRFMSASTQKRTWWQGGATVSIHPSQISSRIAGRRLEHLSSLPLDSENNLAHVPGRQPVTPAGGAGAVPAGGGSSPSPPGGFGQTSGRHYDRPAAMSLDWDRRGRVTPASFKLRMIFSENRYPLFRIIRSAASQEERSGAERWRSFAAASAVVGRRRASALRSARDRIPIGCGRKVTRLSASRRPVFVCFVGLVSWA
jgi:hypothetical protein